MAENLGSASSSSNKRMEKAEIDRLSALPDSILISILSLLGTREAIRTRVLSRRWLFLWTDFPALAFEEESYEDEKISKFVAGVRNYTALCGGNHLQRFEVSFIYTRFYASDVNAWVQFALKHKVKDVALLLYHDGDDYLLPQVMYSNSYLTRLRWHECIMAPKKSIQWPALSSLYLSMVQFHENAIENIVSSCPVLHDLTLEHCSHSPKLDVHVKSKSLRELIIGPDYDYFDDDNEIFMEISAPLMHYARISVDVEGRKLELTDISSLVEADIDFKGYKPDFMSKLIGYTKRLCKNLHRVKKLKAGPEFIRVLGDMVVKEGMQLSQSGVECLQLNARIYNENTIDGIVCLLGSSPNLKDLSISLWPQYLSQDDSKVVELNRDLLHLRAITVQVHEKPAEPLLTLVQLLLKRAPILEKMEIDFSLPSSECYLALEFLKIAQTLLSYPRASSKAAVELGPMLSTMMDDLLRKVTKMQGDIAALQKDVQALLQHFQMPPPPQ